MTEGSRPLSGHWLADLARRLRKSECGTTIVEFALGAIILLSLLLGTVELGRAVFVQAILYYAAESATRWAVVNPTATNDQIRDYAKSKLLLIDANPNATQPGNPDKTKTIKVSIDYTFDFLMPLLGIGPLEFSTTSSGFVAEEEL